MSNKLSCILHYDYLSKIRIMSNEIIYYVIHMGNFFYKSSLVTWSVNHKVHMCLYRLVYINYTIQRLDVVEDYVHVRDLTFYNLINMF